MLSELQRKNRDGGRESVSLTLAANSRTINCLTRGVSHAPERLVENQLPLRWDESVAACHVQRITTDYPMFHSGLKNYKDVLLFQLQKQELKG